ncbi:acetyl-coa carboxylase [Culex quinquefasciatus]|uniref:Acetyl-coa carboxylase n=1 Tax=Culex quinquefasciatus TaxID=7176 RepID=B0X395_CULQU|nr:acetyl-coa carboxylase [Culex quinquefasciatus]|eukprot:XP_001864117.1 acetyl-coa carboxylase [Culex quinquefasciatus]
MYELLRLVFLGPPERAETYRLLRFSSRRISVEVQVEVPGSLIFALQKRSDHDVLFLTTQGIVLLEQRHRNGIRGRMAAVHAVVFSVPEWCVAASSSRRSFLTASHKQPGFTEDLAGDLSELTSLKNRLFNRSLTPNPSMFSPEYIVIDGGYSTHLSKQVSQTMLGSEVADTTQPTRTRSPKLIWTSSKLVPITS